ncbi:MAG: hypothetical protein ACE5NG_03160 [bacterium]
MKKLGYLIITVGFLAGALTTVLDKQFVNWSYFLSSLSLGIIGIALVRTGQRRQSQEKGKLAVNIQNIESSLNQIVKNMNQLNGEKKSINPYDVRHRIDELFPNDMNTFVEARESIAHVYGLQGYADVMSYFAAGERYLNRVWSASTDGYIEEVDAYLDKAHEQFSEALQKLRQLKQPSS